MVLLCVYWHVIWHIEALNKGRWESFTHSNDVASMVISQWPTDITSLDFPELPWDWHWLSAGKRAESPEACGFSLVKKAAVGSQSWMTGHVDSSKAEREGGASHLISRTVQVSSFSFCCLFLGSLLTAAQRKRGAITCDKDTGRSRKSSIRFHFWICLLNLQYASLATFFYSPNPWSSWAMIMMGINSRDWVPTHSLPNIPPDFWDNTTSEFLLLHVMKVGSEAKKRYLTAQGHTIRKKQD